MFEELERFDEVSEVGKGIVTLLVVAASDEGLAFICISIMYARHIAQ